MKNIQTDEYCYFTHSETSIFMPFLNCLQIATTIKLYVRGSIGWSKASVDETTQFF